MSVRALRLVAAAGIALLLAGCSDLDTSYGTRGRRSVNGVELLRAGFDAALPCATLGRPEAADDDEDDRDLLVHVMRQTGVPAAESCAWIRGWLEGGSGRRFVLVLRDGTLGPWLRRRWAGEARAEARRSAEPAARERLEALAARLDELAEDESDMDAVLPLAGAELRCDLFTLQGRASAEAPARIDGLVETAAPPFLFARLEPRLAQARTLLRVDGRPWAVEAPVGQGRLLVVAGASPLLDAAQVDPGCRRILAALVEHAAAGRSRAGWLERLGALDRGDETPDPGIFALLFGRPPFSWIVLHLLVLMVVFLAARAAWLGRVEAPSDRRIQRFARHIEALARHLRQAGARRAVVHALARACGRPAPEVRAATIAEALAAAQDCHRPERARSERTPPSQESR